MTKKPKKTEKSATPGKARTLMVVQFGSEDNYDMPTERDYNELRERLASFPAAELPSLPILIVTSKTFRIRAMPVVLSDRQTLTFKPARTRRIQEPDPFLFKALGQFDSFLKDGKPLFIMLPYYYQFEVVKE